MIIGTNSDEGRLNGTQRVANYAMNGAPVWQYFFDYVPDWRRPDQPNGALSREAAQRIKHFHVWCTDRVGSHSVPLRDYYRMDLDGLVADYYRPRVAAYIDEEYGHEQWILTDLTEAGFDAAAARDALPAVETELMVSYAYDTVHRRNPVGFFGMVHVLEGTSAAIATRAAEIIAARLDLPRRAFKYLLSHGTLDQQHVGHFDGLIDRLDDAADRAAVLHAARMFYRLYGDVFRALPRADVIASTDTRNAA